MGLLDKLLARGVSFASMNYRLSDVGPYPMQMHDCARGLQLLRHRSSDYNIDPARIGLTGGSAGSGVIGEALRLYHRADPATRLERRHAITLGVEPHQPKRAGADDWSGGGSVTTHRRIIYLPIETKVRDCRQEKTWPNRCLKPFDICSLNSGAPTSSNK